MSSRCCAARAPGFGMANVDATDGLARAGTGEVFQVIESALRALRKTDRAAGIGPRPPTRLPQGDISQRQPGQPGEPGEDDQVDAEDDSRKYPAASPEQPHGWRAVRCAARETPRALVQIGPRSWSAILDHCPD